eukprot:jgi/Botrbrau1/4476/Bobra.0220s0010.1
MWHTCSGIHLGTFVPLQHALPFCIVCRFPTPGFSLATLCMRHLTGFPSARVLVIIISSSVPADFRSPAAAAAAAAFRAPQLAESPVGPTSMAFCHSTSCPAISMRA